MAPNRSINDDLMNKINMYQSASKVAKLIQDKHCPITLAKNIPFNYIFSTKIESLPHNIKKDFNDYFLYFHINQIIKFITSKDYIPRQRNILISLLNNRGNKVPFDDETCETMLKTPELQKYPSVYEIYTWNLTSTLFETRQFERIIEYINKTWLGEDEIVQLLEIINECHEFNYNMLTILLLMPKFFMSRFKKYRDNYYTVLVKCIINIPNFNLNEIATKIKCLFTVSGLDRELDRELESIAEVIITHSQINDSQSVELVINALKNIGLPISNPDRFIS